MSKMSQTHAELSEQAYDLGYSSLEEAFNDGYESAYFCGDPVLFRRKHKSAEPLIHQPSLNAELDEAHREWEAEKAVVLVGLDKLYQWHLEQSPSVAPDDDLARLLHAIDFVKRSNL